MLKITSSLRKRYAMSAAIWVLLLLSVWGMQSVSKAGRVYAEGAPSVGIVQKSRDTYGEWVKSGVRGRLAVHLGAHLPTRSLSDTEPIRYPTDFPIPTFDELEAYEKGLKDENYLWVACQRGIVREVVGIVPQERMPVVRKSFHAPADAELVTGLMFDFKVTATTIGRLPAAYEPCLLDVDASYFSPEQDAKDTWAALRKKGLRFDIAVVSVDADDSAVTEWQRGEARRFAELLRNGGGGSR